MIEASGRMQLIVTTHSDIIIDALSETPESVVVCERHDGQTTMRRLVESELTDWLKDYRLGQLWTKGSIGGNRW
jgi:predicted ATPase